MASFQVSVVSLLCFVGVLCTMNPAESQTLRYEIKPEQVVHYKVTIVVETPGGQETMAGVIQYTGKAASSNVMTLEYQGGLKKTTKQKAQAGGSRFGGRFGGGPGGPPIPRSPFDTPDFRGLTQTTNTLVLNPQGEVSSMKGDSQLPYVLGNLSLLPLDALPAGDQQKWETGTGVTITSSSGNQRFGPRFGPFGSENKDETKTAGGERTDYQIKSLNGDLVNISKTYSLTSPAAGQNETGFEMKGSGTWVFNKALSISESLDMKLDLVISQDNSQVRFPMTVAFHKLSETELAEHRKQVEEQQAAMQQRLADLQAKAAGRPTKPVNPKPIERNRKKQIMTQLKHSQWAPIFGQLNALRHVGPMPVVKEDMDLMVLVGTLQAHSNKQVNGTAKAVWAKWKATFEELATEDQKAEVVAAYPTALETASAAESGSAEDSTAAMKDENPFEEENPFKEEPKEDLTALRTWKDSTGKFEIRAKFEKLDGDTVIMKKEDDSTVRIPRAKLSDEDRKVLDQLK